MLRCDGFSHSHHCHGTKFVHWIFVANSISRLSMYREKAMLLLMHFAATLICYPFAVLCSMLVMSKWQSPRRCLMFRLRLLIMCWVSCSGRRLLQRVLSGQIGLKMHVKIAIGLYWEIVWFAIRGGMVLGLSWYRMMMHYGSSWSKCITIPHLENILGCIILWVHWVCNIGSLVCKVMSVGISDVVWYVSKLRLWLRNHRGFCSHYLSRSMPFQV